ncbi:MAG: phosphotransferase [Bacteroidota bacterium]
MQFFPVEYSSLSSKALLESVIINYDIDINSSITFLKRGFNDTYLISGKALLNSEAYSLDEKEGNDNGEKKYILRVYKYNWRSFESIETEIKLLNHLKDNSVSVSYPIKDKQAKFIQTIQAPEGIRYAVLFAFAEGIPLRKLSAEQSFLLGVETGKIHSLTKDRSFGETAHNYDIERQFENTLSILKPVLINHTEQYNYLVQLKAGFINMFNSIDKLELRTGICHGDLQAENFHITLDDQFTFFDFDFFGTGYLAYDIGVFMWYDHKNKTPEIINAFLKGYQTQEKLSSTELQLLPYFSTLRALFQMALFCKTHDGKQLPLWPAQQVADFVKKVNKWQDEHKTPTNYG